MLRLNIFNVGQASSILVDFGRGRLGIIDCGAGISGKNPLAEALVSRLREDSSASILFVLFTHLDWDHISGFGDIFEESIIRGRIRRLFCDGPEFRSLWEAVATFVRRRARAGFGNNFVVSRGLKSIGFINKIIALPPSGVGLNFHHSLVSPQPSDPEEYPVQLKFRELGDDFSIWALSPSQVLKDRAASGLRSLLREDRLSPDLLKSIGGSRPDWNAASTVLVIEHKGARILVSGDANSITWEDIFARGGQNLLNSDIIVAWHHGAKLGVRSGENYDEKVWGSVLRCSGGSCVVISHGCGHYGHPHEETISSIGNFGGSVVCTQVRDRITLNPEAYLRIVESLGLGVYHNLLSGWDVYSDQADSCSGDIVADINDAGGVSVRCQGPRQFNGTPRPACCLYSPTKEDR